MHLTALELTILLLSVVVGGVIQGSIGFGLALVVTPILSLVAPRSIPATILFLALPMTVWMALRERSAIDKRGFVEITLGRLPGTAVAAFLIGIIPGSRVTALIGAVVIAAALLSSFAPEFELRTRLRVTAGVASGFMGTIAAVGGPPLALAYQRQPGPELRSTLAVSFVVGSILSLGALGIANEVRLAHLMLALQLLPGLVLGLFLAGKLSALLDRRWLRPAVLIFAVVSGLVAMWKGLA